ncbi:MAG TPA: polysaccharide biosynthesis/export family protein [Chitinophagaceae bacterium]|nr:polysaccharide biosynthesis/export family protein [Chitinophagaceae bacterium]
MIFTIQSAFETLYCKFSKSFVLSFLILALFAVSCSPAKNLNYFPTIRDQTIPNKVPAPEPQIQINDLLSIIVSSSSAEASAIFNAPNESSSIMSSAATSINTLTVGYLVNQNGDILFPVLGQIHVLGQTKFQVSTFITQKILEKKLLIDPIVTIRYLNFKVSVMGEVSRPGVFTTPTEKLSILEALSFAGDITIYGERNDVLLIRENDKGEKIIKHLDLTNQIILSSPYFYLKSNDVLIVSSNGGRIAKEKNSQTIPIFFAVLSFLIVAVSQIKFN